ncbi:hypothetical protein KIW84_035840 [Lathyrus oleraceus]|uniref:Uncharacterized protein n=1 Tax=Pisum sativum TaxID=3888 RepID=A0A9D5B1B2_PEA|nr:hypothetical protein KIW84_035840 [Pisum sativum]
MNHWKVLGQEIGLKDISDHTSVWIKTNDLNWGPKPFRVFNCWFYHPEFRSFVVDSWNSFQVGEEPDLSVISIEEIYCLKMTIAKLEQDKENLEFSPYDMTYKKNLLNKAQAKGQRWKRSWELDTWEKQEMRSALATQIRGLERSLAKSQAATTR